MKKHIESLPFPDGQVSQVVKLPWRKFPGLVVQGDTIHNFYSKAIELRNIASKHEDEELASIAEDFLESFGAYIEVYEECIKSAGYDLPY